MANKKEEIIRSAIDLYYNNGFEPSAADVAERAKCSKKLVFSYFVNMEGLSSECFHYVCSHIMDILRTVPVPEKKNIETIRIYMS